MSGAEITSANDDASFAKSNRKQLLLDSGSAILAATKYGEGQLGYCTSTSSGYRRDIYYSIDPSNTSWFPLITKLMYRTNWGTFLPNSGTVSNDVFGQWVLTTTTGTPTLQALDTSHGRSIRFTTGASAGNQAGFREDNRYVIRRFNPVLRIKFAVQETTNNRMFIGLADTTSNVGNTDDPLNTTAGIGLAIDEGVSTFRVFHNDSAGTTVSDNTGLTIDTSPHEFGLYAEEGNNKFIWDLDLGLFSNQITTEIPAETDGLAFQATYTTTTAVARSFQIYQACIASTPQGP